MVKTFMTRLIYISQKEDERVNSKDEKDKRKQRIENYARSLGDRVKNGQI
ncbi:hypothetical protein [Planococcus sp. YIM B11945]